MNNHLKKEKKMKIICSVERVPHWRGANNKECCSLGYPVASGSSEYTLQVIPV